MEILRFLLVSIIGLVFDLAVAFVLATYLGQALWFAAFVGFTAAAMGNYILHDIWTFRSGGAAKLSRRRAVHYFLVSGITLASRLIAVTWLATLISRDHTLAILIIAAVISFFVNYSMSKYLVFAKRQ